MKIWEDSVYTSSPDILPDAVAVLCKVNVSTNVPTIVSPDLKFPEEDFY